MVEKVGGVVLTFDFLEKIEVAKIRALWIGEVAVGVVAVVAFDAVFRQHGLDVIDRLDNAWFAFWVIPVALDF